MKKKIILIAGAMVVALAAMCGVKSAMRFTEANALFYENVDALMASESGSGECWNTITTAKAQRVLYCGTCTWILGRPTTFSGEGMCN